MPRIALDEFLQRLQNSVAIAQLNIEHGNRGRLERLVEMDREGRLEALTWSFVIDGDDAGGLNSRTVRLPISTLRRHLVTRVAEFSLDMKVTVEDAPPTRATARQHLLQLVVHRRSSWFRRRLHDLTLRLTGKQPGEAKILINGSSLKNVCTDDQSHPRSKAS